jgi:DnaK suppressor protein
MIQGKEMKELKTYYENEMKSIMKTIEATYDFEVDVAGDLVDEIQGESMVRLQNQLSKRDLQKYRNIQAALEKISKGAFGECEECGEDIGFKRLKSIPGATLCISCAEQAETKKPRYL